MAEQGTNKPDVDEPTLQGGREHATHRRDLNDALRRSFIGGRVVMTTGVAALPESVRAAVLAAVQCFDAFDGGNDPYDEHDFGALTVEGVRCCWKIDTYDHGLRQHSPDPAVSAVTVRVLTVMLAEEW